METGFSRSQAIDLLKKYNKEKFHLLHAVTLEEVMKYFAEVLGYGEDVSFWGLVGLLHDIDYEQYPQLHCQKAPELLKEINASEDFVHAVVCHGYNITVDVAPQHQMEKVLYAIDELTGLIGAAARMRPSKSVSDMELSSLKKKYKDKKFAAGCSREIIEKGADLLEIELDELLQMTLDAMKVSENRITEETAAL